MTTHYGVIIRVDPARRRGDILAADSRPFVFDFSEYRAAGGAVSAPQSVTFVERPPRGGRPVAAEVRPATGLPRLAGRVNSVGDRYGFVRLADGRAAWFSNQCTTEEDLAVGERVEILAVPGRDDRLFALAVERPLVGVAGAAAVAPASPAAPPVLGVASLRGRRPNKSVNDDAFLVHPVGGAEEAWLLAVADGVSKPSHGWWASDKCLELLWRAAPACGERLLQAADRERELDVMRDWARTIHEEFHSERGRQYVREYKQATSTLTFAVARPGRVLFANSGDTPLYRYDRRTNSVPAPLIADVWARSRDAGSGLRQHMGTPRRDWRPTVNDAPLLPSDILFLCSDGVVSGETRLEKFNLLRKALGDDKRDLQRRVEDVLVQIAELGENDDLTLLAYQPPEPPCH
jgi:serine/threonine protein phosphatase PrpC